MDLVGEYMGATAPKVKKAVAKSLGGVFFLDEAHRGGGVDHGCLGLGLLSGPGWAWVGGWGVGGGGWGAAQRSALRGTWSFQGSGGHRGLREAACVVL